MRTMQSLPINILAKVAFAACLLIVIPACGASTDAGSGVYDYANLPAQGNAANGQQIFEHGKADAPACASCHHIDSIPSIGPGLGGLADRADSRVSGQSAREYIFNSIIAPAKFIVPGFSNQMYGLYGSKLTSQDVADTIAYVLAPAQ